jgi:HEAT repeat protein
MSDEGDFKSGRVKPAYIVGGIAVVGLIAGLVIIGKKTTETTLRPEEVQEQVRKVLVRPLSEQVAEWRKVLDDPKTDERMRQEAIFQLARLRDKESLPKFIKLLGDSSNHATVRVLSMAILEFPRKDGEPAKAALQKKLDASNNEDQPQIASALVYLRDKESFKKVFEIYKRDVLKSAKTVDGSSSFDPEDLIEMTDRATFRSFAKDEQAGVRQLVANVLSKGPTKEDLSTLIDLLKDKDVEVSSAASVGIAKLNDPSASDLLVQKLGEAEKTDNETARKRYIEALKNGIGGAGLVYALKVVPHDVADLESRGRFILEELRDLADPAAAQAYKDYLKDEKNPPHYRAQLALALADVGDPDAVPFLAARMDAKGIGYKHPDEKSECEKDPTPKCFSTNLGWKRQPPVDADPVTFREQQFSAQDIGDLAVLFPDKKQAFLAVAGPHIKTFNNWFPAPWLVASRALAYMGDAETLEWTKKTVKDLKAPDQKLVNLGDGDPSCGAKAEKGCLIFKMNEFATATRYVGYAGDASYADILAKWLERPKTKKGDEIRLSASEMELATNPGFREFLLNTSQAAVDGLAEWGPAAGKASDKVLKLMKDKDHGMFPRLMAGRAFGMIASEKDVLAALKEAKASADPDFKVAVLMAAQHRPGPEVVSAALDFIAATQDPAMLQVNSWAARVVGYGGTKGVEDRLLKLLDEKDLRVYAALAIALGGDDDIVRRGMVLFEQKSRADNKWENDLNAVRSLYLDTFDSRGLTVDDVDSGRLFRFVRNASIMKRAGASGDQNEAGKTPHEWAAIYLQAGLRRLDMNATVPGGMDRLVLRYKLNKVAKTGDDTQKQLAIDTLKFFKEQGSIMALRDEAGSTGEMARRAFFELRHPEVAMGAPGEKEKDPSKEDKYFSKPKK